MYANSSNFNCCVLVGFFSLQFWSCKDFEIQALACGLVDFPEFELRVLIIFQTLSQCFFMSSNKPQGKLTG